ncbi:dTMP kinase [Candidatus Nanosalina sp. VS9-1]|uniref:dTMP kinase n=1 Tax=Candidatus Nanosalina sp. VS9-1 TaxID=3388566 RepID=UPI0039E0D4B7
MKQENRAGSFIVIEGPDASGKQTQTKRLVEWLRSNEIDNIDPREEERLIRSMPGNYPDPEGEQRVDDSIEDGVWHLSFPTYGQTPGGRVVDSYLKGRLGDRENLSLQEKVDIYAADRKQFKTLMEQYISRGGIIVCDRYREANLIHQLVGFEGEAWNEKLEEIKSVDSDLPDADEVFYLDISPEEARQRMSEKEKDIHELDDEYMKASNLNGRKVAEHEDWSVIDGERTPEEVEKDLRERVSRIVTGL